MRIVFIHGMNQQNYNATTLKQYWVTLFENGLKDIHADVDINTLDISLPFYGDLLSKHQLKNSLDLTTFLPKSWGGLHLPFHLSQNSTIVNETHPNICALPTFNPNHSPTMSQRLSLVSALSKDHVLKEFIIFLNHYPKLHLSLIQKFLIETYLYLENEKFMHEVDQRIMQHLQPNENHIIVAHSLGTVIAYNLLHKIRDFRIQTLITLGSPLAYKVIQDKLPIPISRPKQLKGDWINFYSPDDYLTAFPLSNAPFDFHPAIINFPVNTPISTPHKIAGYLEHPKVIQSIIEALKR